MDSPAADTIDRYDLPNVFDDGHCAWKIIDGPKDKDLGCWSTRASQDD